MLEVRLRRTRRPRLPAQADLTVTPAVLTKVLLWWMALVVLAVLNGALREAVLIPSIGAFAGLIASGLILSVAVFLVAYVAVPGLGHLDSAQYWIAGSIWLALTVIFEFSFGLFVEHKEFSELLRAYTFKGGNIWPVVLVSTLVSPWLSARLRARRNRVKRIVF